MAKHQVTPDEVEEVLADKYRLFEMRAEGLYFIVGRTFAGGFLEVVYRKLPDGTRMVFQAMNARGSDKKHYQKRR